MSADPAQSSWQDDYEFLRDHIRDLLNPTDDDVAEVAILEDAISEVVSFVERQVCACTPERVEDWDPCDRCAVLGRLDDRKVER